LVYRNDFRLPIVTLRPFAFIGPYQDLDKPWAINNFIRDAILGVPIRILGNGLSVRSYLYGSDMGYWIIKSLLEGEAGEVYNIGSAEAVSLNNLAKKINNSLDSNNEILNKSSKDVYTDLSIIVPDNSKIIKHFGVSQNFNLEDSISRTIVWNQLIKK
jgi:dTDP-glucose 4,6-dehydratase